MYFFYILLLPLFFLCSCGSNVSTTTKPKVVVSIPPYATFVKMIAGHFVDIQIAIPSNFDPHFFEPSPQQIQAIQHASVWIGTGEPYEHHIVITLKEQNQDLIALNLSKEVPLLTHQSHPNLFDICKTPQSGNEIDRHFWLSPRLVKKEVKMIADTLIQILPQKKEFFFSQLNLLLQKLDQLDDEITHILKPYHQRAILVSHPSFGYFCYDYHLLQLAIECEGKSPLISHLDHILTAVKKYDVRCVINQPQFDNKGLKIIAEHFQLPMHSFDPLAQNYFKNLRDLAEIIATCYQENHYE